MAQKIKIPSLKQPLRFPTIEIKFLDHMHQSSDPDSAEPIPIAVYGILWKEDKSAYYVSSWIANQNIGDHNTETYCILKSTVISIRKLK